MSGQFCQAPMAERKFSEAEKRAEIPKARAHGRVGKNPAGDGALDGLLEQGGSGFNRAPATPRPSADCTPFDSRSHPDFIPFDGGSSAEIDRQARTSTPSNTREARILAIDIGASGAAALLNEAGDLLDVVDLPTLDSGPACRPEISPALFASIVRRWHPTRAWVEHIGPRAGDRPAGAFSFGASKATVETALAVLGVPFRTITPAVWKRVAGIPAGKGMKDLARSREIERWPAHAESFARVSDHDRAEAALIGWAGLQRERAGR